MNLDISSKGKTIIQWLGQAGFWVNFDGLQILIDPYLSDSLAEKYAGKLFPHIRMMDIPIKVENLPRPDVVLITHAHTDHMDPHTLEPLSSKYPDVPVLVPRAVEHIAKERISNNATIRTIDAGEKVEFELGLQIVAFPSAHEKLDTTPQGYHPYLGYGITKAERRIYHSGDTVPFDTLAQLLREFSPQVAMLPINGRDDYRRKNGVPGNMNAQEAIDICREAKIPILIPHHFGMFEFNTSDPAELLKAGKNYRDLNIILPNTTASISLA